MSEITSEKNQESEPQTENMAENVRGDWDKLRADCEACTACALHATRTHVVVGVGDVHSRVLFVGEAPGEQEDLRGEPFVGRAGQLLDKLLIAADMPRPTVYIANSIKCRPPHNRDPLPEEQEACIGFLRRQLKLIEPKIIVCLGRISAMRLIKPDFRITQEHGQWFEKGGYLMMGIYHPAALLRDPRRKPEALLDLLEVKRKVGEMG